MATYKGIKGVKVVTKASDPTASEADGTVWYNSTGNALKYSYCKCRSLGSSDAMNTARRSLAGTGTTTAAVIAGGIGGTTASETYNGSAWTTVARVLKYW